MTASTKKPTVPEVLGLVREFKKLPGNSIGGRLHIMLDDGNVQDQHVQACLDRAVAEGDEPAAALARVLLAMSKTQRTKILFYKVGQPC